MTFPFKIIDLTHTLSPTVPSWDNSCGFCNSVVSDYSNDYDVTFRVQRLQMPAGIGTHLDAPSHCIIGGKNVNELALDQLIAPCVMIDVSAKMTPDYRVSKEDILQFEQRYQKIQKGNFVIIHTAWEQFWQQPERYRNDYLFPSLSVDAAKLLLDRHIVGLGIDTLSSDRPDSGYPVHQLILGAGKYLVENVAHAKLLPAVGSYSLALPLKIQEATEAPMRLIGLIKK